MTTTATRPTMQDEPDALAELLAASSELLDILRDMPKGPQHEAMIKLCHAIAKAKGEEVPA